MELKELNIADFKALKENLAWQYLTEDYLFIRLENTRQSLEVGTIKLNDGSVRQLNLSELRSLQAECAVIREMQTIIVPLEEELKRQLTKIEEQKKNEKQTKDTI